jgi:hypothetical protein
MINTQIKNTLIILPQKQRSTFIQLLPLIGSVLFLLSYIIAANNYPGGTNSDKNSPGFSLTQNYWCNLLSETALNGKTNPARPFALTGMVILSITLTTFWYLFPLQTGLRKKEQVIIQSAGFLAMITGIFIFTGFHDQVINVAGFFGLIAIVGTLRGLKKLHWTSLFYMGLLMLVLIALNNIFYYKKSLMYYLPVIQKITFLSFLLWICFINLKWFRNNSRGDSL